MTRYYVDEHGAYLGGFEDAQPPENSIEVPFPPEHGSDIWDGEKFNPKLPILQDYVEALTQYLDAGAKIKHYDDIKSAALRAGFDGPYKADGIAYAAWMDSCWQIGYALLAKFDAGQIVQPSIADLLAQLPRCPFSAQP